MKPNKDVERAWRFLIVGSVPESRRSVREGESTKDLRLWRPFSHKETLHQSNQTPLNAMSLTIQNLRGAQPCNELAKDAKKGSVAYRLSYTAAAVVAENASRACKNRWTGAQRQTLSNFTDRFHISISRSNGQRICMHTP